ncbi:hypothetical protein PJP10_32665, partial [Mycobacterium kansasii]
MTVNYRLTYARFEFDILGLSNESLFAPLEQRDDSLTSANETDRWPQVMWDHWEIVLVNYQWSFRRLLG